MVRLNCLIDPETAKILAHYDRRREATPDVIRRAVRLLALADGHLNARGRLVTDRDVKRGQT
ncbi:hypothetical protein BG418_18310 [Streptomyces sp. CBMA152]|nr:hypothetical protein [Streptomyces sp. CBMA152]